jgi:hypothetical protein
MVLVEGKHSPCTALIVHKLDPGGFELAAQTQVKRAVAIVGLDKGLLHHSRSTQGSLQMETASLQRQQQQAC